MADAPPLSLVDFSVTDHGATILGPGDIGQYAKGFVVSVVGDVLSPHMHGLTLVTGAVMVTGSTDTFGTGGLGVCRISDSASCSCIVISGDSDGFSL